MEQNIVQNIATVPSFTDWRNYLIDEPFGMEEKPESEDRINRLAVDYATAMEKENGITQKLAGYDTYFKNEVEAASRLIKIGANFARNEMQQEIDRLTKQSDDLRAELTLERGGSELWKRQRDELLEALREATQWISVKDRLPEDNVGVLAKVTNGAIESIGITAVAETRNGIRYLMTTKSDWSTWIPTHWRPLKTTKLEELLKQYDK